jgi:hypothetical protein
MNRHIRTTFCVATAVVLVSAVSAWAARRHYAGAVTPAGTVTLTTAPSHRNLVVTSFSVSGVPIQCADNSSVHSASDQISGPLSVTHGRFHLRFYGSDYELSVVLKGQFNAHRTSATGTIRLHGSYYPYAASCDTGTLTWKAQD